MLQIINQALMSGFTATQILKFVSSKFPHLQSGIQQAQQSGFDADKILKFLSHKIPHSKESANKQINENDRYLSSIGLKTREEKEQARNKALSGALQVGAGALGGYALSRAIPAGVSAVSGLLGNQANNLQSPQAAQTPQALTQQQQFLPQQPPNVPPTAPITPGPISPTGAALATPQVPNIPQPPIPAQPLNPQRDIKKSVDILKNLGFDSNVKNMLEGGMAPKDISAALKAMMPKDKFKALEAQEGGIEGVINDYAEATQNQPQELSPMEPTSPQLDEGKQALEKAQEIIEPKPITKNSIVASPQGIGEVKEIRNGKALVEVDGKLHKVDEADLEPPLFSDDEVRVLYDDLMGKIPEAERSGFLTWAGYNENTKTLSYIPRGGDLEQLTDISPEEAELIKTGKGIARTTGKNIEGEWILGGDTRGLISQIYHDRRKKREAEEKKQLKLFELPKKEKTEKEGTKTIYQEMQYPYKLSQAHQKKLAEEARELKKKAKEEEKARLKKEKDEAKKRKR